MSTHAAESRSASADGGSGLTGTAQAKAQEASERLQEQAQSVAGQTQDRVREQVDQRSSDLGAQIQQHASDLRAVSGTLREQGNDRPAELADRISGYVERAGGYLQRSSADRILADAEDFGRERPTVMAAGALALGLAASRFLKASSRRRYSSRGGGQASLGRPAERVSSPGHGTRPGYTTPPPAGQGIIEPTAPVAREPYPMLEPEEDYRARRRAI